jgi:hypothetical protein
MESVAQSSIALASELERETEPLMVPKHQAAILEKLSGAPQTEEELPI